LIEARRIVPKGAWSGPARRVTLDYDRRFRRRLCFCTEEGTEILLNLPEATLLRGGDALALTDGSLVEIQAAEEELLEVTAPTPDLLIRLAWHLGNRHLCVQFLPGALRIQADHVIAEMVRGLGGEVVPVSAAFDPETGAYHHG
jgi:urease accessory protein